MVRFGRKEIVSARTTLANRRGVRRQQNTFFMMNTPFPAGRKATRDQADVAV